MNGETSFGSMTRHEYLVSNTLPLNVVLQMEHYFSEAPFFVLRKKHRRDIRELVKDQGTRV